MNHYVYIITNLINGKKYIGKRSCRCPIEEDKYMGSGIVLKNAQKKYGIKNFEKKILLICDTEEEAYREEEKAIGLVKAWKNPMYYNVISGGIGFGSGEGHPFYGKIWKLENHPMYGKKHKEESKKKMSVAKKGKYIGEKSYWYGKTHSIDTRIKMRKNRKGKCIGENNPRYGIGAGNGKNHPMYGKNRSDEVKKKISQSLKGRFTGGDCGHARKIICLNTMQIFDCIKDGARWCKRKNSSDIIRVCKNERKSAGKHPETGEKLVWMYLEDYENKYGKINKEIV